MKKTIFITAIIFFIIIFAINIYIFVLNINNKNLTNTNMFTMEYRRMFFLIKTSLYSDCSYDFKKALINKEDLKNDFGETIISKEKMKKIAHYPHKQNFVVENFCYCCMEKIYEFNVNEKSESRKLKESYSFLVAISKIRDGMKLDIRDELAINKYKHEFDYMVHLCVEEIGGIF